MTERGHGDSYVPSTAQHTPEVGNAPHSNGSAAAVLNTSAAAMDSATQGSLPGGMPSSGYPSSHEYRPVADSELRDLGAVRREQQGDAATASYALAPTASSRNPGTAPEDSRRQRYLAQPSTGAGVQYRLMSAAPDEAPRVEKLGEEFAPRSNDQFGALDGGAGVHFYGDALCHNDVKVKLC